MREKHPVKALRSDAIVRSLFQRTMVTMVIAELSGALSAVIDGIITGHFLGPVELAAFGVGTPYYSIASIISGVLMIGCTAMCTNAVGRGDTEQTSRVFSLTVLLGGTFALLITALGAAVPGQLASLFGAKASAAELHEHTAAYLRGVSLGAPGFILFVVLTPILQLDGDTRRPQLGSVLMAVTDIGGDLLNVFVFRGGMFGMGLASAVSHYVALLTVLTHFARKSSLFRFSLAGVRPGMIPQLTRDGLPRAVCMVCRSLLPILMNTLVLALAGSVGVTAMSAQNTLSYTVASFGWGIGGAVSIMGGMMVGEQDSGGLESVVKCALADILIGVTALAALVFFFAGPLAALFVPEAGEAQTLAVAAIRCYAAAMPFLAFNVCCANYLQAISRIFGSTLVNVGIEVAFTALWAFALSPSLGVLGVWLAYPCGQALLSLVLVLTALLRRDGRRQGLAAHMLLRPDFGVPEADCIERSLYTMDDVVKLSTEVGGFCEGHGIGRREANRLALCVEEMAGNVIEHGFDDGKEHHLDVRVLVKDGSVILRLRDDCRKFDLREKADNWSFDPERPEKNIGIRLVLRVAKNISYTNTMNTNNLIITV